MKIQLLTEMQSCISDGQRTIPVGTVMSEVKSIMQWTYFEGSGFTLVIQGWSSEDWNKVERI